MSYKYKVKDEKTGEEKEIDVFTQEELDTKAEESVKAKEEELTKTFEQEKTDLEEQLEEAKKEPDGGKKDEPKGDDKDKTIEELQSKIDDLSNRIDGDVKTELLAKLSGGDEEVKKKIEYEYNQFNGDITDKSQIEERMLKATKLAIPDESPSSLDEAVGFASKRGQATEDTKTSGEITEDTKKIGKNFGITDEDYEKYGEQIDNTEGEGVK